MTKPKLTEAQRALGEPLDAGLWFREQDVARMIAAAEETARAEALRGAADAWQMGQWADAPRRPDRVQERIANAQFVTDWLRKRAEGTR